MINFNYIFPKKERVTPINECFGSLDIEVYSEKGSCKFIPYCVVAFFNGREFTAYYNDYYEVNIDRRSTKITDLIIIVLYRIRDHMKDRGIKSIIFYAHNLSSFDGYFILKACAAHNLKVDILKRDSEIFYIRVKIGKFKLEFRCSLLLLRQDLNSCAKSFNIPLTKLPFDHSWVNEGNLFYKGKTPFSNNNVIEFKDYALKYCLNDCIMLYNALVVFNKKIKEFNLTLTSHTYSIPGFAFKVFKNNYLEIGSLVNLSLKKSMDQFIRQAYFGGRSEVFMGYIGNNEGYYYDVKGMYAQAMKEKLPCGIPHWQNEFDNGWLRDDMSKGFYRVLVSAPEMNIPLLPCRSEDGKLIFPHGKWTATYYSEELLFAQTLGYSFKPIEAIIFSDSKPFLRSYVEYFTKMKDIGGVYRVIGKLFINSLYGRFGFKHNDEVTVVISREDEEYYGNRFKIVDRVEIGSSLLLTYSPKPILNYYKENGIFTLYQKDMRKYKKSFKYIESNVGVAAAITSLGRIHLYKDILSVIKHGGEIAYCDTDSIYARFKQSPLGQQHGSVYWDPNNPETRFEEGVFLAPKMYSIKNHHTHIKGVKLDSVTHEKLLASLRSKADSLKLDLAPQFFKQNYDIFIHGVNKEFTLWNNDKRIWYEEGDMYYTKPRFIDDDVVRDSTVEVKRLQPLECMREFSLLNKLNPGKGYYQLLEGEVEIKTHKGDICISTMSDSNKWNLVYYSIMGKLNLKIKPIFMKIILTTHQEQVYTLTNFIYNPHIRFQYNIYRFIEWVGDLIEMVQVKYDIKLPAELSFILVYPIEMVGEIGDYEIVYPIPQDISLMEVLKGVEEKRHFKHQLKLKMDRLSREIQITSHKVEIEERRLIKTNLILLKLDNLLTNCPNIDGLIPSKDERLEIKKCVGKSLIDGRVVSKQPSLQNILGLFMREFKRDLRDLTIFTLYLKAAIILIRWLSSVGFITLTKRGKYSPYIVNFSGNEEREWLREEYYNSKIFFDIEDYRAENSQVTENLSTIELAPIVLNHDYFSVIKSIFKGVKEGRFQRNVYGFSYDDESFEGEMLNLEEALTHYEYISNKMTEKNKDCFYMYWYSDSRGRIYPTLTNFSIQSNRIIRAGFMMSKTAENIITKDEVYNYTHYMEYIIKLVSKNISSVNSGDIREDFSKAIELLGTFQIKGSKDHYEVLMRKMELENLFKYGSTQMSPISIDGRCNVFQHISALTKDGKIAPLVNTSQPSANVDIYNWFKEILIREIEKDSDSLIYKFYVDFKGKNIDIRGLVKNPVMTFPYGSTQFNIQKHIEGYLRDRYGKIDWELITPLAGLINKLRKINLKSVVKLQGLLQDIITNCEVVGWKLPDGFTVKQSYFKKDEVSISTTVNKQEMSTTLHFNTYKINWRQHLQGITANFIHSWDAYHLRRIILRLNRENIVVFPIHDSIVFDINHLRVVRRIVCEEFNEIYSNPEENLKSFYNSIKELNPTKEWCKFDIDDKIKALMGDAEIRADLNLFTY